MSRWLGPGQRCTVAVSVDWEEVSLYLPKLHLFHWPSFSSGSSLKYRRSCQEPMLGGRLAAGCGWKECLLNGRPFKVELFVVSLYGRPTLVELVADEVLNLPCFLMHALLCLCLYSWPWIDLTFMNIISTVLTKKWGTSKVAPTTVSPNQSCQDRERGEDLTIFLWRPVPSEISQNEQRLSFWIFGVKNKNLTNFKH